MQFNDLKHGFDAPDQPSEARDGLEKFATKSGRQERIDLSNQILEMEGF